MHQARDQYVRIPWRKGRSPRRNCQLSSGTDRDARAFAAQAAPGAWDGDRKGPQIVPGARMYRPIPCQMADGVKGKETMRKLPILISVLALLLISLFATSRGDPAIAQDGSEFTGAWQVTATRDDGVIIRSITALGAGGVAITVGLPAQPAPPGGDPGLLFLSTAVGA